MKNTVNHHTIGHCHTRGCGGNGYGNGDTDKEATIIDSTLICIDQDFRAAIKLQLKEGRSCCPKSKTKTELPNLSIYQFG